MLLLANVMTSPWLSLPSMTKWDISKSSRLGLVLIVVASQTTCKKHASPKEQSIASWHVVVDSPLHNLDCASAMEGAQTFCCAFPPSKASAMKSVSTTVFNEAIVLSVLP